MKYNIDAVKATMIVFFIINDYSYLNIYRDFPRLYPNFDHIYCIESGISTSAFCNFFIPFNILFHSFKNRTIPKSAMS